LRSNLPPAWSTVSTISTAGLSYLGTSPVGMPRPSSATVTLPSLLMVMSMRVQKPPMTSSMALSTIS